jgi:hypothetical protein
MNESDLSNELDEYLEDLTIQNEADVVDTFGDRIGTLLIEYGYDSLAEIREADDSELLDIVGIGESTLASIREKTAIPGVSDQPATTESEVKPDNDEAEPAESEIAEPDSAEDALVTETPPIGGATAIRSLWPGRLKVTAPSGTVYQWDDSGSQVNVAMEDVGFVMGKNRNAGRACCGGSGERTYFELT